MKQPNTLVAGVAGALVAAGLAVAGVAFAASRDHTTVDAGTTPTSATTDRGYAAPDGRRPGRGGHEALTGEVKSKVEAAATAREPGATLVRSAAHRQGYHVHAIRADGTPIIILVDSDFTVTRVLELTGRGPGRGQADGGLARISR